MLHRIYTSSALVVAGKVAELAETLRIMHLIRMSAFPGLLRAAASMVAIDTHALGIKLPIRMRALDNFLFRSDLIASFDA